MLLAAMYTVINIYESHSENSHFLAFQCKKKIETDYWSLRRFEMIFDAVKKS